MNHPGLRLLLTLAFFVVLVVVLVSPRQAFLVLLALLASYSVLVVAVPAGGQFLMSRNSAWAIRLTRLLGLLTASQDYRITLLAIQKDNPLEADRIWSEIQPHLERLPSGQAMALAANYAASLAYSGRYRSARELLLQFRPGLRTRRYAHFYGLYWLNLGWFQYQLEDFSALEDCLLHAQKEGVRHPQIGQRLQELRALLAYEQNQPAEALEILGQHQMKSAFSAWLLSEMGEKEQAGERLPDSQTLQDPAELTYYHLAQASLTGQSEHLVRAAATNYGAGHVAYHALKHFQDPGYLPAAQAKDPESLFTRRALHLAVGPQENPEPIEAR